MKNKIKIEGIEYTLMTEEEALKEVFEIFENIKPPCRYGSQGVSLSKE